MENDRIRQQEVTDFTMEQNEKNPERSNVLGMTLQEITEEFQAAEREMSERARERYEGKDWDSEQAWMWE